jgi:hypothetical protein
MLRSPSSPDLIPCFVKGIHNSAARSANFFVPFFRMAFLLMFFIGLSWDSFLVDSIIMIHSDGSRHAFSVVSVFLFQQKDRRESLPFQIHLELFPWSEERKFFYFLVRFMNPRTIKAFPNRIIAFLRRYLEHKLNRQMGDGKKSWRAIATWQCTSSIV